MRTIISSVALTLIILGFLASCTFGYLLFYTDAYDTIGTSGPFGTIILGLVSMGVGCWLLSRSSRD